MIRRFDAKSAMQCWLHVASTFMAELLCEARLLSAYWPRSLVSPSNAPLAFSRSGNSPESSKRVCTSDFAGKDVVDAMLVCDTFGFGLSLYKLLLLTYMSTQKNTP